MDDLTRLPTGIRGLDEMIEGGFPFPSVILVAGSAGTGKTTFSLQFLIEGAKRGETGLFITTLSEPTQWMLRFATRFEFLKREYFGKDIFYLDLGNIIRHKKYDELLDYIDKSIAEIMPQRIVIDPITVVGTFMKDEYRSFLFDLTTHLKNWQATTLLTGEVDNNQKYPTEVAYAADGVVLLLMKEEDDARRKYLEVLKMRGTNHLTGRQPVSITTSNGIVVLKARF